jgi:hypothetical protein
MRLRFFPKANTTTKWIVPMELSRGFLVNVVVSERGIRRFGKVMD